MPGPGGGSRGGGGGFSGGSRGGSFGGGGFGGSRGGGFGGGPRPGGFGGGPRPGGFGGPHHHPPHFHGPHFGWGWGWGRPRRYYGGGGGCLGAMMAPIILIVFITFIFIYSMLPAGNQSDFGKNYDEAAFQRAADQKYAEYFDSGATYEDNILLYFLVEEECEDIYFIALVGDNVNYEIYDLFGNEYTEFGQSIYSNVANYYAYSLDTNLAAVVNDMESIIVKMNVDSFKKDTKPASPSESKLVDLTGAGAPDLTADTVNDALASFTEATGIRTVICVDYIDNVFESPKGIDGATVFMILALVALVVVVVVVSVNSKKNRKSE